MKDFLGELVSKIVLRYFIDLLVFYWLMYRRVILIFLIVSKTNSISFASVKSVLYFPSFVGFTFKNRLSF